MIEITFKDFYVYQYREEGFHELYIMKNGLEEILYIGISNQNIWNRWFGWNGHIMQGPNYLVGESAVGRKVVDNLPDSWGWKIQLWTLDDCVEFCTDELLHSKDKYTIKMLGPIMIQKLHPSLNSIYNLTPGADHTPKSEKEKRREAELDRVYREVFDKKAKGLK